MWAQTFTSPSPSKPPLNMKINTKHAAFALLLSLFSLACQSASPNGTTTLAEFRNDQEIGLPVFGMSCPKCANNITHKLSELVGVFDVKVDMGQGFVTVKAAPGFVPTREEFVEAIVAAGFTVPPQNLTATETEGDTHRELQAPRSGE
jgi:copper chaperone CopZ